MFNVYPNPTVGYVNAEVGALPKISEQRHLIKLIK